MLISLQYTSCCYSLSAGCGRTGTFCTIDTALQLLHRSQDIQYLPNRDFIIDIVKKFRTQRMHLVQTPVSLVIHKNFLFSLSPFIHNCLRVN